MYKFIRRLVPTPVKLRVIAILGTALASAGGRVQERELMERTDGMIQVLEQRIFHLEKLVADTERAHGEQIAELKMRIIDMEQRSQAAFGAH